MAREPISRGKVEPCWMFLLGEEAQLNERTDCIRREETRKMSNVYLGLIQNMKITSFLSKAHNWKTPGMVKNKISGFKHSKFPTGILQKKKKY